MGFFGLGRKPWRHPDAKRRLEGLRSIRNDQQGLLAELASDDEDPAVRRAAAARVHKPDLLQRLIDHNDEAVATAARQRLAGNVVDLIKTQPHAKVGSLLGQVSEQSSLAEIALQAVDAATRSWACEQLCTQGEPSPALLARVAIQDAEGTFAARCIERIDKLAQLKEVAKKAKHEQARSLAADRVAAFKEELDKPSPEQQRRSRREALQPLLEEAKRWAASSDWEAAADGLATVNEQRAAVLADYDELEIDEVCQQTLDALQRADEQFLRRREEHAAQQQVEREAELAREEILAEFEAALSSDDADAMALVADFEPRWEACEAGGAERMDELEQRWEDLRRRAEPGDDGDQGEALDEAPSRPSLNDEERQQLADILVAAKTAAEQDDMRAADQELKVLHKRWNDIAGGLDRDDPQRQAFNDCYQAFKDRRSKAREEREQQIEQRLAAMGELVRSVESLADDALAERDADAGLAALKQLRQAWKEVGKVPRHRLQDLLDAFNAAAERVQVQLRAAHEERDWERFANATRAEEIIEALTAMLPADEAGFDEPEAAFDRIKDLQGEWKGLGYLPRERKEDLWERYKAAGDAAYERLQPFFAERDQEREQNLVAKRKLLDELRDLVEYEQPHGVATGLVAEETAESRRSRADRVKALQEEWKAIGQVPREQFKELQGAYRAELDRFYQGRRIQHQHAEEERQENLERKRALIEQAHQVAERAQQWQDGKLPSVKEPDLLDQIKALQRDWRGIGFVPREFKDSIYEEFRTECDQVYAALEDWFKKLDEERTGNLEAKEALIKELEELCEEEHPEWFRDEVFQIRRRWQETGHVPRDQAQDINGRFQELCDRILGARSAGD